MLTQQEYVNLEFVGKGNTKMGAHVEVYQQFAKILSKILDIALHVLINSLKRALMEFANIIYGHVRQDTF